MLIILAICLNFHIMRECVNVCSSFLSFSFFFVIDNGYLRRSVSIIKLSEQKIETSLEGFCK